MVHLQHYVRQRVLVHVNGRPLQPYPVRVQVQHLVRVHQPALRPAASRRTRSAEPKLTIREPRTIANCPAISTSCRFHMEQWRGRRFRLTDRLAPVLPIVLYVGNARWTAARRVIDLVTPQATQTGGDGERCETWRGDPRFAGDALRAA